MGFFNEAQTLNQEEIMIPSVVDVFIVGMGPVGTLAANLLGSRGISVLIIDSEVDIYSKPRAIAFDHDAMRILQSCGLAEKIEGISAPYSPTEYKGIGNRVISRFDFPEKPYPLGWCPNYVFRQPQFEKILRDGLKRFPSVVACAPATFLSFKQEENGVVVTIETPEGQTAIRAQFLLGADGGSSSVRAAIASKMESLDFDEPWLVIDVLCSDDALESLPRTIVQYCNPRRPATYVIGTENHRRWEIMRLPNENWSDDITEEEVWDLLSPWIKESDATLWRWANYEFHAVVAETWRENRVLLLGDAAHMTPPFMAQGMTQGFRDASNLTWKLDEILKGSAPHRFLDSYMEERAPHVRSTTEVAKGLGKVICELNAEEANKRDESMLSEFGNPPSVRIRQSLIPDFESGFFEVGQAGAGSVLPQPHVSYKGGTYLLDDVIGDGPSLLVMADLLDTVKGEDLLKIANTSEATFCLLVDEAGAEHEFEIEIAEKGHLLADWFSAHDCKAALIRPDKYVYGTASNLLEINRIIKSYKRRKEGEENESSCST